MKKPPGGVKLLSIYLYINAGYRLNLALGKLVAGSSSVYDSPLLLQLIGINASWISLLIWDFAWCCIFVIIGRGLWKGINFFRYAVFGLSTIGIVGIFLRSIRHPNASIPSIIFLIIGLIINVVIIYYLLNKNATRYFTAVEKTDNRSE